MSEPFLVVETLAGKKVPLRQLDRPTCERGAGFGWLFQVDIFSPALSLLYLLMHSVHEIEQFSRPTRMTPRACSHRFAKGWVEPAGVRAW